MYTSALTPYRTVPSVPFCSMYRGEIAVLATNYTVAALDSRTSMNALCNGVVVKIGGLDGLKFSNFYYFEYALNWTTVLIDVSPSKYEKLAINRNREAVIPVHGAVNWGEDIEIVVGRTDATGDVNGFMRDLHQRKWGTNATVVVPCRMFGGGTKPGYSI